MHSGKQPKVVHNKMATAMVNALVDANNRGHNPGRVGAQILTSMAAGRGVIWRERRQVRLSKKEG